MRKKILCGFFTMMVIAAPAARAEDNAWDKLGRGVVNVITAPVEVVKQTRAYWIEGSKYTTHISFWLFSGVVKGLVETVKRAGSGLWDVVTFPLDQPQNYQPLLQPAYVFQEWPQRDANVVYQQYSRPGPLPDAVTP